MNRLPEIQPAPPADIFDLAPFPMWIYTLEDYRFVKVNKAAIREYGYSEQEFLSMTIKDIRPQEDIPKLVTAVEQAKCRTELYKETLFRHQKRDASIMFVQIRSNLTSHQGKAAEIVTAIDLTDSYSQKLKLEKHQKYLIAIGAINQFLLKSENYLEALSSSFEEMGKTLQVDRVYYFEINHEMQTTSQRLEWTSTDVSQQIDNPELQEIPLTEFPLLLEPLKKGRHFQAIVSQLPCTPTKKSLQAQDIRSILVLPIMVEDDLFGFIGLDDCKNEKEWIADDFQLLETLTSNLGHVISAARAHSDLKDSEARFKSLVQNGNDLIAIIDENAIYKYVAPNSEKVLGIPAAHFLGKNAFDFIFEDDAPSLKENLAQIITQDSLVLAPYRFKDSEENWRWLQTELSNHLADPVIGGIITNTREVEKKMGDELISSLTQSIGQTGTLHSCLSAALEKLVQLSKINGSEIWLVSEDTCSLNLIANAFQDDNLNSFRNATAPTDTLTKGEGLAGHIWKNLRTHIWETLPSAPRRVTSPGVDSSKLVAAMGIPILYNQEFLGCIICYSQFKGDKLSFYTKLLSDVGMQLGAVVKQKQTEEEYQHFFDISPDPHCLIGFDGFLKKYNRAFKDLLGYTSKELETTPLSALLIEDGKSATKQLFKAFIKGRIEYPLETIFKTKSGEQLWLIWNATPKFQSKVIVAVAKNVTENKRAAGELQRAYARLKTAQSIAKLGYWYRDLDADVSEWSDETYAIYGYRPDNFLPSLKNITEAFFPADRHLLKEGISNPLKKGEVQSYEHRIVTPSQQLRWVRQEIRFLYDDDGEPFRIEGTIQDITDIKEHQRELALSNERFQLAMKASNEIIWDIDHHAQTIYRGKGSGPSFEYGPVEPFSYQNSWFQKIHPDDRRKVWTSLQQSLTNPEESKWFQEYRVCTKNGEIRYFIDRCYIVRDDNGNHIRSIGTALDVTQSRKLIAQVKQRNISLREIAWLQSHAMRAPLSKIMSLVYLHEIGGGTLTLEEILDLVSASAEELNEIISKVTEKINDLEDETDDDPAN